MFTLEKNTMCSPTMWGEGHFCEMPSSSYAEQVSLTMWTPPPPKNLGSCSYVPEIWGGKREEWGGSFPTLLFPLFFLIICLELYLF